jgi:hypothetical protein
VTAGLSRHAQAVARRSTRARSRALGDVAVVAVQALVLVPLAIWRYVDIDEGTYLAAAKLALRGDVPYHDFLYVQMPLLPYVYGVWGVATGESWYAARLLSVAFATGVGLLLYRHARPRFGPRTASLGLLLFAGSGLVLAWYPTVKTYALSTLLLFAAYVLVERAGISRARWLACGLLLGLAVDVRLIFASALPAFAVAAARHGRGRLTALGVGFAAGLLPSIVLFVVDPSRFFFDNVRYHSTKSAGGSLVGDLDQKGRTVLNILGIGTPDGGMPQFLLLFAAAAAAAVLLFALERRVSLALSIAALLGVASLLPTPTYGQYLCTVVPFLVIGVLELVAALGARASVAADEPLRRALLGAGAALVAVYLLLGAVDASRYIRRSTELRIARVEETAAAVNARTRPGERVLMSWPGYAWGSHALPVHGLETDFAPSSAASLSEAEAQRYRMASVADVERMVAERRTHLLVYQNWDVPPPAPDWQGAIVRGGYRLIATVDTTKIYAR